MKEAHPLRDHSEHGSDYKPMNFCVREAEDRQLGDGKCSPKCSGAGAPENLAGLLFPNSQSSAVRSKINSAGRGKRRGGRGPFRGMSVGDDGEGERSGYRDL